MARYVIAFVGVIVVVIGIYLLREVHGDPQPIARSPVVAVLPEHAPAQPAQPSAVTAAGSAVHPTLPTEATPPAIGAPVVKDPEAVADEREAAKAKLTYRPRAMFKPKSNPQMERYEKEAQEAFDKGDLDKAKRIAEKLLPHSSNGAPLLRILTAASCAEGNAPAAQAYYARMTPVDRAAAKKQCAVPLTDPSP